MSASISEEDFLVLCACLEQDEILTKDEMEIIENEMPADRASVLRRMLLPKSLEFGERMKQVFRKFPGGEWLEAKCLSHLQYPKKELSERSKVTLRSAGVPNYPSWIVPRKDVVSKVWRCLASKERQDHQERSVIVRGPGGSGKTTLLIDVLRGSQFMLDIFQGRIIWLDVGKMKDDASILKKLRNLLTALGADPTKLNAGGDEAAMLERFPEILEELRDEFVRQKDSRPPLIVLDNVSDNEIFDYLGHTFPLLVSSRALPNNHDFSLDLDVSAGFTETESRLLFVEALRISVERLPDEIDQLITVCYQLPLAVALTSQLVVTELLKEGTGLETACKNVKSLIKDRQVQRQCPITSYHNGSASEAENTLIKIVNLSLEALKENSHIWFEAFAFFATFKTDMLVPESVLFPLWPVEDSRHCRDFVSEKLVDKSLLLTYTNSNKEVLYSVHSIIKMVLCEGLEAEEIEKKHKKLVERYRNECGGRWGNLSDDGYVFNQLCRHMRKSKDLDELQSALTDFDFIKKKIKFDGIAGVMDEIALFPREDRLLLSLTNFLKESFWEATNENYQLDLRQGCALLPANHLVRQWAAEQVDGDLWVSNTKCVSTITFEAVVQFSYPPVVALTVAQRSSNILVALTKASKILVLEPHSLRKLAEFHLDSTDDFEQICLVNGNRMLLLVSKSGQLVTCSLPERFQLFKNTQKLSVHQPCDSTRSPLTELSVKDIAAKERSLIIVNTAGDLILYHMEFLREEEGHYFCCMKPLHKVQVHINGGPLNANPGTGRMEHEAVMAVFENLTTRMRSLDLGESVMAPIQNFSNSMMQYSKSGVVISPSKVFIVTFWKCSIALFKIEEAGLTKVPYDEKRRNAINSICFITVEGVEYIAEAVGSVVYFRCVRDNGQLQKLEFRGNVSALMFDDNGLFVYSDLEFSLWSIREDEEHKRMCSLRFEGGCAFSYSSKFPTFISGMGYLVQLRKLANKIEKLCSSKLHTEVFEGQSDIFLVEDVKTESFEGVKVTSSATGEIVFQTEALTPIHGFNRTTEQLSIVDGENCLKVVDLSNVISLKINPCQSLTSFPIQDSDQCTVIYPNFHHTLFVGFSNGDLWYCSSDSSQFESLINDEADFFVRYVIPIDGGHCKEMISVSISKDRYNIRCWTNIGAGRKPECKFTLPLPCELKPGIHGPLTITLFVENRAARPAVSPNGRYMAMMLPVSNTCSSLVVIDVESGKHREEQLPLISQGNVLLVEVDRSTLLFAVMHQEIIHAKIDGQEFFESDQSFVERGTLRLNEELKFITLYRQNELILTSQNAVTQWEIEADGRLKNGYLVVPKSLVTGNLVACYANSDSLMVVTQTETLQVGNNIVHNEFYRLERKELEP